jgi:serine phosphatase RsbU (regulator of sigma subunit)
MDVGGDWYDAIPTEHGLALVIGDVEGHNVAAAATMGQLRSAVRAFATAGHPPGDVMTGTNRLLIDLDPDHLASCCYLLLDPESATAHVVNAGHCPPLLHWPDGDTEILDLPGGPLLGVERTFDYPPSQLNLPPGSLLALYTDGRVETRDTDISIGIDRLRTHLAHAAADFLDDLADTLLQDPPPCREPQRRHRAAAHALHPLTCRPRLLPDGSRDIRTRHRARRSRGSRAPHGHRPRPGAPPALLGRRRQPRPH